MRKEGEAGVCWESEEKAGVCVCVGKVKRRQVCVCVGKALTHAVQIYVSTVND